MDERLLEDMLNDIRAILIEPYEVDFTESEFMVENECGLIPDHRIEEIMQRIEPILQEAFNGRF